MTKNFFPKRDENSVLQATICLLTKDKEVLLGMKKRGFGAGKWNGMGGKVKSGETITEAVLRETREEISVEITNFKKAAFIHFYFPNDPNKVSWNQDVHVFVCNRWKGDPTESEEMLPKWFDQDKIPFDKMWTDDKLWMPKVLKGETLEAWFSFDDNNDLLGHKMIGRKYVG